MPSIRSIALFAIPLVAFATLAVGLRVGARSAVRVAVVYGAPPAAAATGLAWQVETIDEDGVVKLPAVVPAVSVVARMGDREARWDGPTNADGVAEMWLDLPGAKRGDRIDLVVREGAHGAVLAEGTATWGDAHPPRPSVAWTRFARRDGDIALDVAVYGQRLAPGFPAPIWVRATDRTSGAPLAAVQLEAEPEGMALTSTTVTTDDRGWAAFAAQPIGHVLQLLVHATARANGATRTGEWAGALAPAPGGCGVSVPMRLQPMTAHTFEVVAPTQRTHAYIEVDDAAGRAVAMVPELKRDSMHTPRGTFDLPKLMPGLYWIVVSSDSKGAEIGGVSTMIEPFFVAATDADALPLGLSPDVCAVADPRDAKRAIGPCLALAAAGPFPRWTALEGFAWVRAREAKNRSRGMQIAVSSLLVAAALETLLILSSVSAARRKLRESQERAGEDHASVTARFTALHVVIGLLVALLGFGLILALVVRTG